MLFALDSCSVFNPIECFIGSCSYIEIYHRFGFALKRIYYPNKFLSAFCKGSYLIHLVGFTKWYGGHSYVAGDGNDSFKQRGCRYFQKSCRAADAQAFFGKGNNIVIDIALVGMVSVILQKPFVAGFAAILLLFGSGKAVLYDEETFTARTLYCFITNFETRRGCLLHFIRFFDCKIKESRE